MGTTGNQQGAPDFGDIRIGMMPLSGGVLAYTFLPPPLNGGSSAGDIVFNSNIAWKIGSNYDLETVALHEIGHALGMDHSALTNAVMYAYYNGVNEMVTSDDIAGIDSIYGAVPADTGGHNSVATAQNITSMINPSTLQIADSGLNLGPLNGGSDAQYFTATVPAGGNGSMTVGMQTTNLSLVSPSITVYNSAGKILTGAALPNSYGGTASVTINGVTAGQQYYYAVHTNGGSASAGAFGLLVNFGWETQSPIPPPYSVVTAKQSQGGATEQETQGPTLTLRVRSSSPGPLRRPVGDRQHLGQFPAGVARSQRGRPRLERDRLRIVDLERRSDAIHVRQWQCELRRGDARHRSSQQLGRPGRPSWGPATAITGAGVTSMNIVVNLPVVKPIAIVPTKPPASPIQVLSPWIAPNTQAQDAALDLWYAPGNGSSPSIFGTRQSQDS